MSGTITFDEWGLGFHSTMAAVERAGLAIQRQATIFSIAVRFWDLSQNYKSLLRLLHGIPRVIPGEYHERFQTSLNNMREVHRSCSALIAKAARKGWTNRSLVNASIQSVQRQNEELLDFIEVFEASLDSSTGDAIASALSEHQRGESVEYRSVL